MSMRYVKGMAATLALIGWAWTGPLACHREDPAALQARAVAESVEALTGSRTRLVWAADHGDLRDYQARGTNRMLRLMGYDSRDGRGPRPVLSELSNYAKPLLTPSGERVVFSDFHRLTVSVVDFDGANRRELGPGMGMAVWRDPHTGVEWVYVGRDRVDRRGFPYARVVRFPLDDPKREETVWDRRPAGLDNFQLSADGRHVSGVFPWPDAGVADLAEGTWTRLGNGCWTSLAPDDSLRFWVFKGNHREIAMTDVRTGRQWDVRLDTSPATGRHEVYHPRWSNDPRIIALTGPYRNRVGQSYTRGGGADVEIHLGRFNETFTEIEAWVQVTDNAQANFLPDVWIEGAAYAKRPAMASPMVPPPPGPVASSWPVDVGGLLFVWENRAAPNEIEESPGGRIRVCRVEPEGRSRFGRHLDMDVRQGRFVAEGFAPPDPMPPTWSLEALITPAPDASGDVLGMATPAGRLALVQKAGALHIERVLVETADRRRRKLFAVTPDEPVHVAVVAADGRLRAYRNGVEIGEQEWPSMEASGVFAPELVFGGDGDGWTGAIEAVAIYGRELPAEEIAAHTAGHRDRLARRAPPRLAEVEARLVHVMPVPDPDAIEPYRRALVTGLYDILAVHDGQVEDDRIQIAHWAILDDRVLDTAERRPGQVYRLTIEAFEDRPELEGEWIATDPDAILLPLYMDIGS